MTQTRLDQDEINAILWKACDTFRGTIDPSEYKNYILVMLFLKYISDVWREHSERLKEEHGDDEQRIQRYKDDLTFFHRLRQAVKLRYAESVDYREYEEKVRKLMDEHIAATGTISLNLKLMQVPKACIDYVLLHELCHLKEHHHGPAFYRLLDRVLPDWRERKEQLNACEVA